MLTACVLLLVIACLGAFDIAYFHTYEQRLVHQRASRTEAWIHVVRGVVYALQLAVVPNLRLSGAWYAAYIGLFVADIAIAMADVSVEPASRKALGGLPPGEYLMHIVLSVLAGAYLHAVAASSIAWRSMPTQIAVEPAAPLALRVALGVIAVGSLAIAAIEAIAITRHMLDDKPRPIHVSVRLRADVRDVWAVTQDHRFHPTWDHRFSRIEMLSPEIQAGTTMRYERDVLGMTIAGQGRYKHHRPLHQSTFEFWSDDPRSLIRRGVGLWLYRCEPDGAVLFTTSYTYDVRWGLVGRVIDRVFFRPFFQRETERSFARLTALRFPEGASKIAGARGYKPARLVPAIAA